MRLESESRLRPYSTFHGLGLMEPVKRGFLNFSWSNSTTSYSTVDPMNFKSVCATVFSLIEKIVPSGVAIFYWS